MNEITVTDLEGNVIVHDGYIVNVDGIELT